MTREEIISIFKSFQESAKVGSDGEYSLVYGIWEEDYKDVAEKIIALSVMPKEEKKAWSMFKEKCSECGTSELISTDGFCNVCGGKQKNYAIKQKG